MPNMMLDMATPAKPIRATGFRPYTSEIMPHPGAVMASAMA